MDNRLHNDCDGGQCWACAQDKLDTMTKYAGAEVDRNASLRTRADIAETAYERCREECAALEAREARLVAVLDIADQLIAFVQQDMDDLRDGQRQGVRGGKDSPRITITDELLSQYRATRAELDAVKGDGDGHS